MCHFHSMYCGQMLIRGHTDNLTCLHNALSFLLYKQLSCCQVAIAYPALFSSVHRLLPLSLSGYVWRYPCRHTTCNFLPQQTKAKVQFLLFWNLFLFFLLVYLFTDILMHKYNAKFHLLYLDFFLICINSMQITLIYDLNFFVPLHKC